MIITFIMLGNYLEEHARQRMSLAIKKLMGLQPKTATVKHTAADGSTSWQTITIDQVKTGDTLQIKPGDQIPIDGIITQGTSTVDQHLVTGESMPVTKKIDDTVIGGTINTTGALQIRATQVGTNTMLAKIIALVKQAQASKAPVQKLVDTISSFFVPIVLALSVISFILWFTFGPEPRIAYAIVSLVSVLIVACPCALGLATPTALIVGIGRGAQEGILIKNAQSLEVAGTITTVIFDKTGTLTQGMPSVQDFRIVDTLDTILARINWSSPQNYTAHDHVLSIVTAVEQNSNHPISQAVVRYVQHKKPNLTNYLSTINVSKTESITGFGIQATVNHIQTKTAQETTDKNNNQTPFFHTILIGSQKLMEQNNVTIPSNAHECVVAWQDKAGSSSFVAFDGQLVAYFCVTDALRTGAQKTIQRLHSMGITSVMITGDNERAAQAVAHMVGIKNFFSQVLPADKQKQVQALRTDNVVAMVGDGINDAPALAAADVGIAMGGGTDIALETASIALLRDDITLVPCIITLSKATSRTIRQNLFWAFGYNLVLIPIAMGALYPLFGIVLHPMLAGAAMACSSISVILNALRLYYVKL